MEVLDLVSLPTDRSLAGLRSDHEEADTRIVLHARDHATIRGYHQINVICRDTDVLVLLPAHLPNLSPAVWVFTGTAKRKLYVPVHQICLSEETRNSLLAFHSITGCDTILASLLALASSHLGAYLSRVLGYYSILKKMKVQKRRCFVMPKPSSVNCTTKAQRKPSSTAREHQRFGEQRKAWIPSPGP